MWPKQLGYSYVQLATIFSTEKTLNNYEKKLSVSLQWVAGHLCATLITLLQSQFSAKFPPTVSHTLQFPSGYPIAAYCKFLAFPSLTSNFPLSFHSITCIRRPVPTQDVTNAITIFLRSISYNLQYREDTQKLREKAESRYHYNE